MTEAMPLHIKENPVYSKIWVDVHRKKKNATLLFLGDVGTGKSYSGLRFCERLDPQFDIDCVCFSVLDFLKLLNAGRLQRGNCALLDEIAGSEFGADSRSFMSMENKVMGFTSTIFRAMGVTSILCLPFLSQLDKRLREIGITGYACFKKVDHDEKVAHADFYWGYPNVMTGEMIRPRPRVVLPDGEVIVISEIIVDSPSKKLAQAYEAKKDRFIHDSIKRWTGMLEDIDTNPLGGKVTGSPGQKLKKMLEVIHESPGDFKDERGKFSSAVIQLKLGVGQRTSQILAKMARTS